MSPASRIMMPLTEESGLMSLSPSRLGHRRGSIGKYAGGILAQPSFSKTPDGYRRVLAVITFLEARRAADEIADRARRQSELGEEPDGGTGRDHVGEVLLGMGGDQYHW